jgi:hypothetical protein
MILVDSSVWVDYFRTTFARLIPRRLRFWTPSLGAARLQWAT